jgi:hypothetical protein
MEFFLHPWYMVAGGALVSSPILIHLINRMRFKRIRWAAMEFLLKSQKRNRRRLIIEQLILLLLRILLVLLIAFLVARFIGAALGSTSEGTMHLVILDDTLSMSDRWEDNGEINNSFEAAKKQVEGLAKVAALASSAQHIRVVLLSNPGESIFEGRIGDRTANDLSKELAEAKPTALHVPPLKAVEKGHNFLKGVPQGQRILHFVSDFRDSDWGAGAATKDLNEAIDKLINDGINLSLFDVAHPFRGPGGGIAGNHDNLAITSLTAESRMVPENVDVRFAVTIRNYGTQEKTGVDVRIRRNGQDDPRGTTRIDRLPPGESRTHEFVMAFTKTTKAPSEFVHVGADINAEQAGLEADHVRNLVVEVRQKIPILVVDGKPTEGEKPGGDTFHVREAFDSWRYFQTVPATVGDLANLKLEDYTTIYLLNVPEIKNEDILNKLRDYTKNGGSLAWFLGKDTSATFCNDVLHKQYEGLFPVMIRPQPTAPLTEEQKKDRIQKDEQQKILFPDPYHPLLYEKRKVTTAEEDPTKAPAGEALGLWRVRGIFRFLLIDRYYELLPKSQWNVNAQKDVERVIVLPNRKSPDAYKDEVGQLINSIVEEIKTLAGSDDAQIREFFKGYEDAIGQYRTDIRRQLSEQFLSPLANALERTLHDEGEKDNKLRPNMKTLWAHPKMRTFHQQLKDEYEKILYGDPLLLAAPYGKGKVVVFTTTAGTSSKWNNWGGGSIASGTYSMLLFDLQRYLSTQIDPYNRIVTDEDAKISLTLPASEYSEKLEVKFQPQAMLRGRQGDAQPGPAVQPEESLRSEELTEDEEGNYTYSFPDGKRPGVLIFETTRRKAAPGADKERILYAFNVDTETESNLRRVTRERLDRSGAAGAPAGAAANRPAEGGKGKVLLFAPGDDITGFKAKDPDASESPWLYLFFILILVVEQALAVHLSFHLKAGETPTTTPVPAPAATAA